MAKCEELDLLLLLLLLLSLLLLMLGPCSLLLLLLLCGELGVLGGAVPGGESPGLAGSGRASGVAVTHGWLVSACWGAGMKCIVRKAVAKAEKMRRSRC